MGAKISKRGSGKLRKKSKTKKIERPASIINLTKAQIYEDLLDEAIRKQYEYDDNETPLPPQEEVKAILKTKHIESEAPNTHSNLIQKSSTNTIYYDISEDNDSFYDAVEMESVNDEKENVEKSPVSRMRFTGPNRKVWTIVSLGNKNKEEGGDFRFFERTNSDPSLNKTKEHDSLQYQKTYTSDAVLLRKDENWDWDNSRVDTSFDFAVFDQILNKHRNTVHSSDSSFNYDDRLVASRESSQSSDLHSSDLETSEEEEDTFEDAHLSVDVTNEFEKVDINNKYIHQINDYSMVSKTDFHKTSSNVSDNVIYRQHTTTIPLRKSATLSSLEKIEELQEEAYGYYDLDKTKLTELTTEHKRKSSLNSSTALANKEVESLNSYSSSKQKYSSTSSDISEQEDKSVKEDVFKHPIEISSVDKEKEILKRQDELSSSFYRQNKSSTSSSSNLEDGDVDKSPCKDPPKISLVYQDEMSMNRETKTSDETKHSESSFLPNQRRKSSSSSRSSEENANNAHVKTNNHYLLNSSTILTKYEELGVTNPTKHEYEFLKSHDPTVIEENKETELHNLQFDSHITNFEERRYSSSTSSNSSDPNSENKSTIAELKIIIKTIDVLEKEIKNEKNTIDIPSTYQKLIKIMMQVNQVKNDDFDEEILELQNVASSEINRCLKMLKK